MLTREKGYLGEYQRNRNEGVSIVAHHEKNCRSGDFSPNEVNLEQSREFVPTFINKLVPTGVFLCKLYL